MVTDLIEWNDARLPNLLRPEVFDGPGCPATSGTWVCSLPLGHEPTLHQAWGHIFNLCAVWEGTYDEKS